MSRISIILAYMVFVGSTSVATAQSLPPPPAEDALTVYARQTATRPDCRRKRNSAEIFVCGKRESDRYRLPLIIKAKGDPRGEGLEAERLRIQHITTPCQDNSVFLVGCGFAGITLTTRLDGAPVKARPLAD